MAFKKLTKVRLFYDKYAGGPNGTSGSWVLGSPAGGGVGHMPSQPGIGTITLVDNTTQHPPDPGDTCEETTPKSDCGTVALLGPPLVSVTGDGKRRLVADLVRVDFDREAEPAGRSSAPSARRRRSTTSSTAAAPTEASWRSRWRASRTGAHKRLVRVAGFSHKVSGTNDCARGNTCTDDVTRRVTVTFTRL